MKTLHICMVIYLGQFFILGCSESSNGGIDEPVDTITGYYSLEGYNSLIVDKEQGNIEETRFYGADILYIKLQDDGSIRFYGLLGGDTGRDEHKVYPGCTHPDDCPVLGNSTSPEGYRVQIENEGRVYEANLEILTTRIYMTGSLKYEGREIVFKMDGQRFFDL